MVKRHSRHLEAMDAAKYATITGEPPKQGTVAPKTIKKPESKWLSANPSRASMGSGDDWTPSGQISLLERLALPNGSFTDSTIVADLENMVQYRRNEHGRRRKIKRDIIDIPKKGVAGLRLDCDANTVNLARESSADGADSVPAQSGASVQSSSVRPLTSVDGPLTSPATPSPDAGTSLEDSFAHLQLGGDSIVERSHRGEGEEEHESPSSGRVPAPDTSIEETESDASSDSEDVSALVAQHSLTQQRLLVPNPSQTVSDRSVAAGGTVSVRSRRPDGQCTVTEV
ncbi:E3 ubiquitin-protein ligase RNF146-B-like [Bos indicus]|uniref:E3 ubiquitin-protein ligase n=1 Tax=Bos indicus TaxID=9915 RepID=A0ABM4T9I3_BOSIN